MLYFGKGQVEDPADLCGGGKILRNEAYLSYAAVIQPLRARHRMLHNPRGIGCAFHPDGIQFQGHSTPMK
jgi:hypothetical protein